MLPGIAMPMKSSAVPLAPPPLDAVGSASGAWGTRKLRSAYAGNCLKVRRSSDSTTQDIGFSGNDLDTGALISFVGAGDGFIDTWYDQTGNGRNLTQATTASQPKIVSSGAVITTVNGRPSPLFDASNDYMTSGIAISNFITAAAYTLISASRVVSGVTGPNSYYNRHTFADSGGYFEGISFNGTHYNPNHYSGAYAGPTLSVTYPVTNVFAHKYDGTNVLGYVGGGPGGSAAVGNVGSTGGTGYMGFGASAYFDGNIPELIIYSTALSTADLNTLGANLASQYGTSWTTIP